MNPIYFRRVRRIPPIVSAMSQGSMRRRRVKRGGTFLPSRTKQLNYDWVRSALKKRRKRRRRWRTLSLWPGRRGSRTPCWTSFGIPPLISASWVIAWSPFIPSPQGSTRSIFRSILKKITSISLAVTLNWNGIWRKATGTIWWPPTVPFWWTT